MYVVSVKKKCTINKVVRIILLYNFTFQSSYTDTITSNYNNNNNYINKCNNNNNNKGIKRLNIQI